MECQNFRQQCISATKCLEKIKLKFHAIKCEKDDFSDNDSVSDIGAGDDGVSILRNIHLKGVVK